MTALLDAPEFSARSRGRLAGFAPNWFASVMGTGIVANAAMLLPVRVPGLITFATVVWVLAAGLLAVLLLTAAAHLYRHPDRARAHHTSLTTAPFFGTVAMALLTVGTGALSAGQPLIGLHAALILDAALWTLGTAGGLLCAVTIPYLMFTLHRPNLDDVFASWLLPVVPPVVAATTGAGLLPHLSGQLRLAVELICGACFGISVLLAAAVIVLLWARLALRGIGPAHMVPTLWLVLGPLGSSMTAACLLAHDDGGHLAGAIALAYSVPVWGFAMLWMALAAVITVRAARRHLPFGLSWWAFTFPVGTTVTGTSELAVHTHAAFLQVASVVLYAGLLVAWLVVAVRTARGAADGSLFPRHA